MASRVRRTRLVPSQVPLMDLLYAHGLLCDWVHGRVMEKLQAQRHCEVINNYQKVLRQYLRPGAPNFQVVATSHLGFYMVEPIGGWYHGREDEKPQRDNEKRGCAFSPSRRLHRDNEEDED